MFELFYVAYLGALAIIGGMFNISSVSLIGGHNRRESSSDLRKYDDRHMGHDALATRLGNRYRGMGVIVGLLGATVILCALIPLGTELSRTSQAVVGVLEITLMLSMLLIVIYAKISRTHSKWIYHRRCAEHLRYSEIELALNSERKDFDLITHILKSTLSEQIQYNRKKCVFYEKIEHFSNLLAWVGFFLAFVCAVAHLFIHWEKLIFFTAFGPVLVGAIHSINGFLRISDLAEDHAKIFFRLDSLLSNLEEAIRIDNFESAFQIASLSYEVLCDRDSQWEDMIKRVGLKLA